MKDDTTENTGFFRDQFQTSESHVYDFSQHIPIVPYNGIMLLNPRTGNFDRTTYYISHGLYRDLSSITNPTHLYEAVKVANLINDNFTKERWSVQRINTELAKIRLYFVLQDEENPDNKYTVDDLLADMRKLNKDITMRKEELEYMERLFVSLKLRLDALT